jgi:hypothetical protein
MVSIISNNYSISGVVKYADLFNSVNPPIKPITNSIVNIKQGANIIATTTTDINGNFTLTNVPNGTYTYEVITTKLWNSLAVNLADYAIVKNYVNTGLPNITGIYLLAADANNNGSVNLADYALIYNRVNTSSANGWSGSNWIFKYPVSVIVSGNNISGVVITGILRGDVNGSYSPPLNGN